MNDNKNKNKKKTKKKKNMSRYKYNEFVYKSRLLKLKLRRWDLKQSLKHLLTITWVSKNLSIKNILKITIRKQFILTREKSTINLFSFILKH